MNGELPRAVRGGERRSAGGIGKKENWALEAGGGGPKTLHGERGKTTRDKWGFENCPK